MTPKTPIPENQICCEYHRGVIETISNLRQEIEKKINEKINYWENFIKENKIKEGSIRAVRVRIIIVDFQKLKQEVLALLE